VAVIATIVGAAAGANLVLLVLDISADRQVRGRAVEMFPKEPLEAHPSTV
jgi:hypothetical protein